MKKIKLIALVLAAVMLLSMIPMTAGAADVYHPIVKDVVEFSGLHASSDNYFALGDSLYNSDGNCIFTIGAEDEMIYTLTDHCMITLVSNVGNLRDDENPENFEDIEFGFNLYSINGDEVTLKSSFDNYPFVRPYEGNSYTAVWHADVMKFLDDPFGSGFEEADILDLIFGYDIIDEYGNVVYSKKGKALATPIGDGIFLEGWISAGNEEMKDVLRVTDNGVKGINIDSSYIAVESTELGDVMVITEDFKCGVMNLTGDFLVMDEFDEVLVSDEYYIANETSEDFYSPEKSYVYDRNGKCVWKYDDPTLYYNGKVAIVDTYFSFEAEGNEYTNPIMKLIDLSSGEVIVDAENIYCEGGYIFAESTLSYPFGTLIYTTDGELLGGKGTWQWAFVDEGDSTIIVEDTSKELNYRINSSMEIVEAFPKNVYPTSSHDGVSVVTYVDEGADCEDYTMNEYLLYKGEKITDDHFLLRESFETSGCEVYVFVDYSEDGLYNSYTAYVLDTDRSPFYDVHEDYWAREYIDECFDAGIMNGTGGGKFSPSGAVSRAQVVTTLWRLAGEPAAEGENTFVDVADGTWYTDAVKWAAECGITTGVGGDYFAPDRTVTRGEVAAILYRYAEYAGDDVTAKADLSTFADADELFDWNRDAFAWCAAEGIITGKTAGESSPVRLAPSDALTRAEIAAVLCRYGI